MKTATFFCLTILSTSVVGQSVTVSTTPQNAEQVYYRLSDDAQTSAALSSWDIAFEITGITGSVLVNTAKGMAVYKAPYTVAQWDQLDTAGLAAGWPEQQNSEVNWSSGALNQGLTANPFDLGWGIYDFTDHSITGDSLFVFRMADGTYKKFMVNGFAAPTNSFTFTLADLDGGSEQVGTLDRSAFAGKNFGYYSFATASTLDLEPSAADWDLLFTKYKGYVTQPTPAFYPVVGVFQNRLVTAQQVDGVPTGQAQWDGGAMSADMNVIGFDWKTFNMGTFSWEYAQDRTYFVKDRSSNIWKLVFTGYGGGASGTITFSKELISSTAVAEAKDAQTFLLAPNPATEGRVGLIIDSPSSQLVLSIHEASGRMVQQELLTGLGGLVQRTVQLSGLGSGLYVVKLEGPGVSTTARLTVE